MAIEAPYSKYRKQNCFIIVAVCILIAGWCIYDGYINDEWIQEHTNEDGSPQTYLVINRNAPFFLVPIAILAAIFWFMVKDKKIIADENELIINENEKIPYDAIQKIDKTHYDKKGYFVITYKTEDGSEKNKTITYKANDNTKAILEHLVSTMN